MKIKILTICCILGFTLSAYSLALEELGTGYGFPRFVSLKGNKANLRTGPGRNFPIEWVYQSKNVPLKVIAEYGSWYKVEDKEGSKGWMHQTLFSSRRMIQISSDQPVSLHDLPSYGSKITAWAYPNSIGYIIECEAQKDWCKVGFQKYKAYVERNKIWGVLAGEIVKIED